jgi:histidinol phosphatase-like enzyme
LAAEARERQNKMKVIFLDIDGVLNCKETPTQVPIRCR